LGKITVIIPDELEKNLRKYIAEKYPQKTYGKLSEIVTKALHSFMLEV